MTTESSKRGAITLSRMNLSSIRVGHYCNYLVECVLLHAEVALRLELRLGLGLGLGLDLVSVWLMVIHTYLYYFPLSLSLRVLERGVPQIGRSVVGTHGKPVGIHAHGYPHAHAHSNPRGYPWPSKSRLI